MAIGTYETKLSSQQGQAVSRGPFWPETRELNEMRLIVFLSLALATLAAKQLITVDLPDRAAFELVQKLLPDKGSNG